MAQAGVPEESYEYKSVKWLWNKYNWCAATLYGFYNDKG